MVSKLPVQSSDPELQLLLCLIPLSVVLLFVQQLLEDSFLHHILTLCLIKDSYVNISFMTNSREEQFYKFLYIPAHIIIPL